MTKFLVPGVVFLLLAGVLYIGVVHSPNRPGPTKLLRIEGRNLDNVKRSNIKAA